MSSLKARSPGSWEKNVFRCYQRRLEICQDFLAAFGFQYFTEASRAKSLTNVVRVLIFG
jgi:hypothetical protein